MKNLITMTAAVIGFSILLGTGIASANDSEAESDHVYSVSPEQVITFKGGTIACDSEKSYEEMMEHLVEKERSKFSAMFRDATCIMVPETEKYRVLSFHGGFLTRFGEFAPYKSDLANGF